MLKADVANQKLPRFSAPASFLSKTRFNAFYLLIVLGTFITGVPVASAQTDLFSIKDCRQCVTSYDSDVDYFPNKVFPDTSLDWDVEYHKNYKIIENKRASKGNSVFYAYLCGTPKPDIPSGETAVAIEIPLRNYIIGSSTHAGYFEQIAQLDSFVGYPYLQAFFSDNGLACFSEASSDPDVTFGQVGYYPEQEGLNDWFSTVDESIDAVFVDNYNAGLETFTSVPDSTRDCAAVIEISEQLSDTPIQHLEWVEYISLFFNKERLAEGVVSSGAALYNCHKGNVNTGVSRESVLYINSCSGTTYDLGKASGEFYNTLVDDSHGSFFDGSTISASYASTGTVSVSQFETYFGNAGNAVDVIIVATTFSSSCNLGLAAFSSSRIYSLEGTSGVNIWFGARFLLPGRTLREFMSMIQPTGSDPDRIMFTQTQPDAGKADFETPTVGACNLEESYDASDLTVGCTGAVVQAPVDISGVDTSAFDCTPTTCSGNKLYFSFMAILAVMGLLMQN